MPKRGRTSRRRCASGAANVGVDGPVRDLEEQIAGLAFEGKAGHGQDSSVATASRWYAAVGWCAEWMSSRFMRLGHVEAVASVSRRWVDTETVLLEPYV